MKSARRAISGRKMHHAGLGLSGMLLAAAAPMTGTAYGQSAGGGSSVVLDPISVTAPEVAPGGVQIREEQIERRNPASIKDVFAGEAAVNVGGGSNVARKSYVNGFEDTNLNVKIDGARQINSAFHHLGTAIVDPGMLKAVRVETGVGPADVGPGALGGSIAYETKDARDLVEPGSHFGGFGRLTYDSNVRGFSEVLAIAGRGDHVEALFYASDDNGGNHSDGNGRDVPGTAPDLRNAMAKFAWTGRDGGRLELQASYLSDKGVRPNRANFGALTNGAPPTFQTYGRRAYSLSYVDENPTETVNPELVFSYNRSALFIDELAFGPFTFDLSSETTSYNGKAANTFTTDFGMFNASTVTVGLDFFRDVGKGHIEGGFGGAIPLRNRETSENVGGFVQTRLNVSSQFRVSLGGRLDYQRFEGIDGTDLSGSGPSGSLNVEYDVRPGITPYAGVGSTYGGIPLGESAIYNFARQWTYTGLTSSRSANYKLGLKGERGRFSGDVNFYYSKLYDSHDRGTAERSTTRDLRSRGVNISAQFDYGAGAVRGTFSHNRFRSNGQPLASGLASFHGLQTGDLYNLEAWHELDSMDVRLGASLEGALEDDKLSQTSPNKSYNVVNIYGEWVPSQFGNLSLRADIKNLFDKTYVDRLTSGVDNAAVIPFNEPGRTLLLSAKVTF